MLTSVYNRNMKRRFQRERGTSRETKRPQKLLRRAQTKRDPEGSLLSSPARYSITRNVDHPMLRFSRPAFRSSTNSCSVASLRGLSES